MKRHEPTAAEIRTFERFSVRLAALVNESNLDTLLGSPDYVIAETMTEQLITHLIHQRKTLDWKTRKTRTAGKASR